MQLGAKMSRSNRRQEAGAAPLAKPPEGDAAAAVRQLHAMVRDARMRLTAPTVENLDDCRRRLDEAAEAFGKLQAALPSRDPKHDAALSAPLGALRAEIARVAILLDGAAAFHTGWMRRAACMVSGYGADGTPAQPEARRRVLLEI
jgi:hypothetical protein